MLMQKERVKHKKKIIINCFFFNKKKRIVFLVFPRGKPYLLERGFSQFVIE
jgi:hypothetical protein